MWRLAQVLLFATMLWIASAPAQADDLTGEWRGENSGNRVTITMREGGFAVAFAQTQQTGQADGTFFFRKTGNGIYRYNFPSGEWSTAEEKGPNALRITNSDGWTDLFRRIPGTGPSVVRAPPTVEERNATNHSAALELYQSKPHDPKFARFRKDALDHCKQQLVDFERDNPNVEPSDTDLIAEGLLLSDTVMTMTAPQLMAHVASLNETIRAGGLESGVLIGRRLGICLYNRRIAQLEELAAPAVVEVAPPPQKSSHVSAAVPRPSASASTKPPVNNSEKRYFIEAVIDAPDFVCDIYYCAKGYVKVRLSANDGYGTRNSGSTIDQRKFGFEQSLPAGTVITAQVVEQGVEYDCETSEDAMIVPAVETATNIAQPIPLIRVTCKFSSAGRAAYDAAKAERQASDKKLEQRH